MASDPRVHVVVRAMLGAGLADGTPNSTEAWEEVAGEILSAQAANRSAPDDRLWQPFTGRDYERFTQRDMVLMTFRTRRELANGYVTIPVGTECRVTYKRSGLAIEGAPCPGCGVRVHISHVMPGDLDVLADERGRPVKSEEPPRGYKRR